MRTCSAFGLLSADDVAVSMQTRLLGVWCPPGPAGSSRGGSAEPASCCPRPSIRARREGGRVCALAAPASVEDVPSTTAQAGQALAFRSEQPAPALQRRVASLAALPISLPVDSSRSRSSGTLKPLPRDVENVADDPSLHNPLARMQRLGTGWMGVRAPALDAWRVCLHALLSWRCGPQALAAARPQQLRGDLWLTTTTVCRVCRRFLSTRASCWRTLLTCTARRGCSWRPRRARRGRCSGRWGGRRA